MPRKKAIRRTERPSRAPLNPGDDGGYIPRQNEGLSRPLRAWGDCRRCGRPIHSHPTQWQTTMDTLITVHRRCWEELRKEAGIRPSIEEMNKALR